MTTTIESPSAEFSHERSLIEQLLVGQVDFVEAGDTRIPGQPGSLRAMPSGDPEKPLSLYDADKVPRPEIMRKASVEEALAILAERRELVRQSAGASSRIYTLKLRKRSAEG